MKRLLDDLRQEHAQSGAAAEHAAAMNRLKQEVHDDQERYRREKAAADYASQSALLSGEQVPEVALPRDRSGELGQADPGTDRSPRALSGGGRRACPGTRA